METTKEKHATHTPKPWVSEDCTPGESVGLCFAIKSKHTIVARTTDGWKEARANARLMAASPELLEQCKHLEKIIRCRLPEMDTNIELAKLRELLAKVEGGEG